MLSFTSQVNDTTLTPSTVIAMKEAVGIASLHSPVSSIRMDDLKKNGIYRPNQLSAKVPGVFIPDYGASLTSSIYVRGLGSRMENPVMGLYVDGIPVLDKNAYDTDWTDVRSAIMVRGPQGTLYGRNSMVGVLAVSTFSPSERDGFTGSLEYGTAGTVRASGSLFSGNNVFSMGVRHTEGYFMNIFKNEKCDPYDGLSARWKWEKKPDRNLWVSNSLFASASREGGFAYGRYSDGMVSPVSYNDEGSYRRINVIEGLRARRRGETATIDGAASLQLLSDDMRMDQDFTLEPVFTLRQKQLSGAGTIEVMVRKTTVENNWNPVTGLSAFYRHNNMEAPVNFKSEGIRTLIEGNANRNIPGEIGSLDICDDILPIDSGFGISSWGTAIFHESAWKLGNWQVIAGARLDYEAGGMAYDCLASLHYRFIPIMKSEKEFGVPYSGRVSHSSLQLLPKVSVSYGTSGGFFFYTTVSKGYRAGGFNTQIFSDILQNQVMNGLMKDLGVYLDRPSVSVGAMNTVYDPEVAWNYEIGSRFSKDGFRAELSVFRMDVRNQQLTVFPPGMSTGRMMTNAGKSRSAGAEGEALWRKGRFDLHLAFSWCDARFISYLDGDNDWSGNRIPYSPSGTVHLGAGYSWPVNIFISKSISANASASGVGPIWWDEANTLKEGFRTSLDGRIAMTFENWELYVRGSNLGGSDGMVFYFKSVGKEFFSRRKPRTIIAGITVNI